MNVNSGIQQAQKLEHPAIVEACRKKGPAGFSPIKQFAYVKNLDKIRKQLYAQHGKENIEVIQGHCQLFRRGGLHIEWFNDGAIVYLRDTRPKKRRSIWIHGKEIEAGAPDYSQDCTSCGARPVVPELQTCGPCTWGEMETENGNW